MVVAYDGIPDASSGFSLGRMREISDDSYKSGADKARTSLIQELIEEVEKMTTYMAQEWQGMKFEQKEALLKDSVLTLLKSKLAEK